MNEKIYKVQIKEQSLEDGLQQGKYDFVTDFINPNNFVLPEVQEHEIEVKLFRFENVLTNEGVQKHLNEMGYRPIDFAELLHFGAQYPDVQKQFPIVALGTEWEHPIGRVGVPCLWSGEKQRYLYFYWSGIGWFNDSRFAAVAE